MSRVPDVDAARPPCCPHCKALAKSGGRIWLQGHGVRSRGVVDPGLGADRERTMSCWARRYRCAVCTATCTVLPPGVLPRLWYSLVAIVRALVLVVAEPVGQGVDDRTAYACQGRDPPPCWRAPWPYRWRSLDRWECRLAQWWPGRAVTSAHALLAGFIVEVGDDLEAILGRAAASHARWEVAM